MCASTLEISSLSEVSSAGRYPRSKAGGADSASALELAWADENAVTERWKIDRVFEPRMSRDAAAARMTEWGRAVERCLHWAQ